MIYKVTMISVSIFFILRKSALISITETQIGKFYIPHDGI